MNLEKYPIENLAKIAQSTIFDAGSISDLKHFITVGLFDYTVLLSTNEESREIDEDRVYFLYAVQRLYDFIHTVQTEKKKVRPAKNKPNENATAQSGRLTFK